MPFDIQIVFIFAFEFYWDIVWKADLTNLFLHYVINQFYKVWDYRNKLDIDPNQKIPLFMVLPKQYFEETFPNINLLNVIYSWFFNETIDKEIDSFCLHQNIWDYFETRMSPNYLWCDYYMPELLYCTLNSR